MAKVKPITEQFQHFVQELQDSFWGDLYRAENRRQAEAAFRAFRQRWQRGYGPIVRRLERDLPQLLSFFSFPRHLWKKLRTTNRD